MPLMIFQGVNTASRCNPCVSSWMRYAISSAVFAAILILSTHVMAEDPQVGLSKSPTLRADTLLAETSTDRPDTAGEEEDPDDFIDEFYDEFDEEKEVINDPIEPLNRAFFQFNDKLYFWILKPVAQGYSFVVPEKGRVAVKRFFLNLTTPVRFVNSVLQFKFHRAGTELSRFIINTTIGVAGFMDPARDRWNIYIHREDFGQTLGFFGSGPGFYINWPILGPSSARDTIGWIGDLFLDPTTYFFPHEPFGTVGVEAYERVNNTSLSIGIYEDLKKDSLDPYTFIRDAYHQHRESLVKE